MRSSGGGRITISADDQVPAARTRRVTVHPITKGDLVDVGAFLHDRFSLEQGGDAIPADTWAANLAGPWTAESSPRHGVLLREADRLVGAYVAYYSPVRETPAGSVRFCNLADWAVLDDYRSEGLSLLFELTRDKEVVLTDFTARAEVAKINRRLGFREYEAEPYLAVNIPSPLTRARIVVGNRIEGVLSGRVLRQHRDHVGIKGLVQFVVVHGGHPCLVMVRRRAIPLRRLGGRSMPVACILHVSDQEVFRRASRAVARHLVLRHGLFLSWSEVHVTGRRPKLSRADAALASPRMYRSRTLQPRDIDYLYSELMFG